MKLIWYKLKGEIKIDSLYILLISMLPVVELRGAMPIGYAMGLNPMTVFLLTVAGNILPVPIIYLFLHKVFELLKVILKEKGDKIIYFVHKRTVLDKEKMSKIEKYKYLGLYLLVSVPLPLTGAWTGTAIATLTKMDFKKSVLTISLGVITSGIIVSIVYFAGIKIFIN